MQTGRDFVVVALSSLRFVALFVALRKVLFSCGFNAVAILYIHEICCDAYTHA